MARVHLPMLKLKISENSSRNHDKYSAKFAYVYIVVTTISKRQVLVLVHTLLLAPPGHV